MKRVRNITNKHPSLIIGQIRLFEDEQIYVFIDKSVGIVETNSLLLSSDVRILSGITYENVAKKISILWIMFLLLNKEMN